MIEWGPWIEHDGARPASWSKTAGWPYVQLQVLSGGRDLRTKSADGMTGPDDPRFYWRWRRVRTRWFISELRRVCDDPAYAPAIRYRFGRPRSVAADRLAEIAATPLQSITGPEGPKRPMVQS